MASSVAPGAGDANDDSMLHWFRQSSRSRAELDDLGDRPAPGKEHHSRRESARVDKYAVHPAAQKHPQLPQIGPI
jgi:hypothetical protein